MQHFSAHTASRSRSARRRQIAMFGSPRAMLRREAVRVRRRRGRRCYSSSPDRRRESLRIVALSDACVVRRSAFPFAEAPALQLRRRVLYDRTRAGHGIRRLARRRSAPWLVAPLAALILTTLSDGRPFSTVESRPVKTQLAPTLERAAAVAAYFRRRRLLVFACALTTNWRFEHRRRTEAPLLQAGRALRGTGALAPSRLVYAPRSGPARAGDSFEIRDLVDGAWILMMGSNSTTRRRQALHCSPPPAIARFAARGCRSR